MIAAALAVALLLFGGKLLSRQAGQAVIVEQDGQETARYALLEDRTVKIEGQGGFNILVIEGGQVWLSDADCPNLLCVKTGKIRYAGQSIVCLPHRLVVKIVGGQALDGVTGG